MIRTVVIALAMLCVSLPVFAVKKGDAAPQIIGRNITGDIFALSRLEAKPKVINFFWVECKPCKAELPLLAKKEKEYSNIVFAAVHAEINQETESNYDIKDIQRFAKTLKGYPKNFVLGSERVKMQYGIDAFPASVLLSADNKVEKVLIGFNDQTIATMEAWLKQQQ